MIRMGLVHMLIKRLEINTENLTESHNTSILKKNNVKKSLRDDDDDDEMDAVLAKRVKIDYSPNRFIPVRVAPIACDMDVCKWFLNYFCSGTSTHRQGRAAAFRLS